MHLNLGMNGELSILCSEPFAKKIDKIISFLSMFDSEEKNLKISMCGNNCFPKMSCW